MVMSYSNLSLWKLKVSKFIGYHDESEMVELAGQQNIEVSIGQFPGKQELMKYMMDNGFNLDYDRGPGLDDGMDLENIGEELGRWHI